MHGASRRRRVPSACVTKFAKEPLSLSLSLSLSLEALSSPGEEEEEEASKDGTRAELARGILLT